MLKAVARRSNDKSYLHLVIHLFLFRPFLVLCQSCLRDAGKFERAESTEAALALQSHKNTLAAEEGSADRRLETCVTEALGNTWRKDATSPSAVLQPCEHQQAVAIFIPELIPAEDFDLYR